METDRYEILLNISESHFEFLSEGPRGCIVKVVQYFKTNRPRVYNLGLGDKNPVTGEIDFDAISDNKDRNKILATVAATVYSFLKQNPLAWIYAEGSNKIRTRLYRMAISINLDLINQNFEIYGLSKGRWSEFERQKDYEAFLFRLKES